MKISSKTIYGLRFLLSLADEMNDDYKQLNDIAALESISEKFLESIAGQLKLAGIVSVKRGSKGGYRLSKSPKEILISDIFKVLEGEKLLSENQEEDFHHETINKQVTIKFIYDFEKYLNNFLSLKSLNDIILLRGNININHSYQI